MAAANPTLPSTSSQDGQCLLQGCVVTIKGSYGFIKPGTYLPRPFKPGNVFFHFSVIQGRAVDVGDEVRFSLDPSSPEKPKASSVEGKNSTEKKSKEDPEESDTAKAKKSPELKKDDQLTGRICRLGEKGGHVRVANIPDDFYFERSWIKSAHFELAFGDTVEFSIGSGKSKSGKPVGHRFKLRECAARSAGDIENYLMVVLTVLESQEDPEIMSELLLCEAVWHCIAANKDICVDGLLNLVDIIILMKEKTKGLASSYSRMLKWILGKWSWGLKKLIQHSIDNGDSGLFDKIKKLLLVIASTMPEKCVSLASIIKPLVKCSKFNMEGLLYEMFTLVTTQIPVSPSDLEWNLLPCIPSQEEIDGVSLPLTPVKTKGPYSSPEEYIDTYFRLLREDCFDSITKGIASYLAGSLDKRDMDVFTDVVVKGINISRNQKGVSLALRFTPAAPIRNWKTSSKLMYGNLVCLSDDGSFNGCIWATVCERDAEILNKDQIIWVELCTDFLPCSEVKCLSRLLSAGKTLIMAESPTYYRAYEPVLRALQNTDPVTLSFQDELVKLKASKPPEYVNQEEPDTLGSAREKTLEQSSIMDLFKHLRSTIVTKPAESKYRTMDSSQRVAMEYALHHRVALIQGPPGTGKTYIGAQLAKEIAEKNASPVLLLTYKNHALDEFLKHLLSMGLNKIVRVGGRSKDMDLEEINMRNVVQDFRFNEMNSEIYVTHRSLLQHLEELAVCSQLTPRSLILSLTMDQMENFLQSAPWGHISNRFASPISKAGVVQLWNEEKEELYNEALPLDQRISNVEKLLIVLLDAAAQVWLPSEQVLKRVFPQQTPSVSIGNFPVGPSQSKKQADDDKESESDEEDVENQMSERRAAAAGREKKLEMNVRIEGNKWNKVPLNQAPPRDVLLLLGRIKNLWSLSDEQKAFCAQALIWKNKEDVEKNCHDTIEKYSELMTARDEFEICEKAKILSKKSVIGMTMTGASIHHKLLQELKPPVVLVEEAGEVLEPQIVAVLGDWVKHLILIGDHKQLRPSVQSFNLCKDYHLDVSLFERLINNGFKYASLKFQNRMRVEMASLLSDIYPDLQSNLDRVKNNEVPNCVPNSIFVWSHQHEEEVINRSYVNDAEARCALALAQMFVNHGWAPNRITILAAYRGQLHLFRRLLKHISNLAKSDENKVQTFTIDMYQGDENDIVIVSLVRSNKKGNLGYMRTLNRRCVAQSRAKCGMYFVGNVFMLRGSHWEPLMSKLDERNLVSDKFPVQCPVHKITQTAQSADEIPMESVCVLPCQEIMECGMHQCSEKCQPKHSHHKDNCKAKVTFRHLKCGHVGHRRCCMPVDTVSCKEQCPQKMQCGIHQCTKLCYRCDGMRSHRAVNCAVLVNCVLPCNHAGERRCNQSESDVPCLEPCPKKMECKEHPCPDRCRPLHSHDAKLCTEKVKFTYVLCNHVGTKKCGQAEQDVKCTAEVRFTHASCGHAGKKKCYQSERDITCKERCKKRLPCGHPCQGICGDPCDASKCEYCEKIAEAKAEEQRKEEAKARKEAKKAAQKELERIKEKLKSGSVMSRTDLLPKGDTASEYWDVEDRIKKYIQPGHKWYPHVTQIEKITNFKLLKDWNEAKLDMFNPLRSELKFHGTNAEAVANIIKTGFKMPANPGMYGAGIYFATDASKSAQEMYVKGSNMLLLCDVLIGRSLTVEQAAPRVDFEYLKRRQYDSVFAPRDTNSKGGVRYDEYIVYRPSQALPKYIIHYRKELLQDTAQTMNLEIMALKNKTIQHHSLLPKRGFDPADPLDMHFRIAESQFLRLKSHRNLQAAVKSVEFYINPELVCKFRKKEAEFKAKYGGTTECVLAFHGTHQSNHDSIIKSNFSMDRCARGLYGKGIYFSEFPDVSEGYAAGCRSLLLCSVLPGKAYKCPGSMPDAPLRAGYDSHMVCDPTKTNMGQMIIIFNPDQILPSYIVNF